MNKLMEKLIDEFEIACHLSFDCIERENFAQAIQTACKAQRNACRRMCEYKLKTTHNPILDIILSAEIRKEDYE